HRRSRARTIFSGQCRYRLDVTSWSFDTNHAVSTMVRPFRSRLYSFYFSWQDEVDDLTASTVIPRVGVLKSRCWLSAMRIKGCNRGVTIPGKLALALGSR